MFEIINEYVKEHSIKNRKNKKKKGAKKKLVIDIRLMIEVDTLDGLQKLNLPLRSTRLSFSFLSFPFLFFSFLFFPFLSFYLLLCSTTPSSTLSSHFTLLFCSPTPLSALERRILQALTIPLSQVRGN